MRPRRFPRATKVFELEGGNEDNSLWVEVGTTADETVGEVPFIRSVFELTDEERQEVADGANISLTILGLTQPPVMLRTTTERLGR